MVGVRRKPRIVDDLHLFALSAPERDAHRILVLSLDAHVERLETALQHPAGKRIRSLAPDDHLLPHFLDVWRGTEYGAAQHVVMAIQELCRRMDHDVRAVLERAKVDWAGKRRIDDERETILLRQVAHGPQIQHAAGWIHRRLEEHRARFLAEPLPPPARLVRIHQRDIDAERRELVREQALRATVNVATGEEMIAGAEQSEECTGRRAHAARKHDARFGPVEGSEPLLDEFGVGRVPVARIPQLVPLCRLRYIVDTLVERRDHGSAGIVRVLAGVDGQRGKSMRTRTSGRRHGRWGSGAQVRRRARGAYASPGLVW